MIEPLLKNLLLTKGDLDKIEDGSFVLAYKIADKSFFHILLKNCNHKLRFLDRVGWQSLLRTVVEDKQWNILMSTLDKCHIDASNEDFIVELSLLILKENKMDIFKNFVRKYFQKDSLLHNRETYLTNAINNVEESLIISIFDARFFDINKPNFAGETPLILACKRLMVKVVEELMKYDCDITHNSCKVVEVTMAPRIDNCEENGAKATQIMKLLFEKMSKVSSAEDFVLETESIYEAPSIIDNNESDLFPEDVKKVLESIISLLIHHGGDITKVDSAGDSVISFAYGLTDKQIFNMFISTCPRNTMSVVEYPVQSILTAMVLASEFELFKNLLDRCNITEGDDDFLFSLALLILKRNRFDLCQYVLKKCSNRNNLLINKETFVTNLFKENIPDTTIMELLGLELFDLNVINGADETALMIACERLLPEMIGKMLQYGSDVAIRNYKALELVIAQGSSKENVTAKTQILDLFFNKSVPQISSTHEITIQSENIVSEAQFSVLAKYPLTENVCQQHSRTSFLEMILYALYAKSDYMDYIFDSPKNHSEIVKLTNFLSTAIVYPLRKYGYIDRKHVLTLVEMIHNQNLLSKEYIGIREVSGLFAHLSSEEMLLSLTNMSGSPTNVFYLSLSAVFRNKIKGISIQDLINASMIQENKMFAKVPACLILEVQRHRKGHSALTYVIPSDSIVVSDVCIDYMKMCYYCDSRATFCCYTCIEANKYDMKSGLHCDIHMCKHMERKTILSSITTSKSHIKLDLRAIICHDSEHFVAFINDRSKDNKWLKFTNSNDARIPSVIFDDRISQFIASSDTDKKRTIFLQCPPYLRQLISESCIFIYENTAVTCY